ncbi:hypothetical protein ABBQ32_008665 [Trebouxia sp. C0010 RCD-2024]
MTLSNDDIIFTLGTQSIQKLPGTSAAATTVNTGDFAEVVVDASGSIEAASYSLTDVSTRYTYNTAMVDLFNTFQQGAFNLAAASFLQQDLCCGSHEPELVVDKLWHFICSGRTAHSFRQ